MTVLAGPATISPPSTADAAPVPGQPGPPPVPGQPRPPQRPLRLAPYPLAAALALERELGVSHALAQVLARRGLTEPERAAEFLRAADTYPPSAFAGIDAAVATIRRHVAGGGRIVVHGDYDVDGVCATAILVRALRALGAQPGWFLPSRSEDGYGLTAATVARLAARGTALIVTVDCGITAVEEVAAALGAGVDVVVTDHHSPRADGALPGCPIVHPELCGYPFPSLCGTAVAFKLAQALGARTADDDLDLVALATVADLVPLVGENRSLVRDGRSALASTAKPGLRALMAVAQVDPGALDAGMIGFRLAPRINAAGRLARADAGLELLLCEDPVRARAIADELDLVNAERRAVERRITWEAERQVAEMGPRSAYVLAADDWHPGVIGIVAGRIAETHHRPAILIALDGEVGTGSGRGIGGFDLLGALHACAGAGLGRYGGHRAAAGLTIDAAGVAGFREAFERHCESVLTPDLLEPVERADAVVSGTELGLALADELRVLEPCGLGNPAPRLLVPGAQFEDLRPMGQEGRHARFSVRSGGARARAVAFDCDGRIAEDLGAPQDATFTLRRNSYNGAVEAQLTLRHARPSAPAPVQLWTDSIPGGYMNDALAELDAPPRGPRPPDTAIDSDCHYADGRELLDRRGHGSLATLADAVAGGSRTLALCADVPRRLSGLAARAGGFALAAHHELERAPDRAHSYDVLVALDPPSGPAGARAMIAGEGVTVLAWGEPELRFAQQIHELEYGLRGSLVSLYRALRARERAAGEELEHLLRGDGPHDRPARLAGRLIRVLWELELVSLDRDLPALAIASTAPTALERSPSFRVYAQRYEDGTRYLSSANLLAGG
ncbi:MAG: single-stranded-DNA-specific exonuclease RecJ [Solirubrobacteraceae bacterium]